MPFTKIYRNTFFFEIVAEQDITLDFKVILLENRNSNITSQLASIFKVFENFKFTNYGKRWTM